MRVAMAQLNPTVGDFAGNLQIAEGALFRCAEASSDLVIFSELFLSAYPPRDLLEREWFIAQSEAALSDLCRLSRRYPGMGLLVGAPTPTGLSTGKGLHNSALLICDGDVIFRQHKSLLPTYDVFDEARYFDPATEVFTVPFRDETLGISICEDAWTIPELWLRRPYQSDPIAALARAGATLLLNISASPFSAGKDVVRYKLVSEHARRHGLPFILVNQVGAHDELIFDGNSLFVDAEGELVTALPEFEERIEVVDTREIASGASYRPDDRIASVYSALLLGIRDYMRRTGFTEAILGMSGGIDSAVVASLAAAALGPGKVTGVAMPSQYSSEGSLRDARVLAETLGIRFEVIPIRDTFEAYEQMLAGPFAGRAPDVAEENIQSRIRGNILMALSNKFGYLVLTTGNKSEIAVGYCTLYGDMAGGLAVLADVPKTMVYELAHYINRERQIIPAASITKPPSAELRPNQTDQDTLPPYEILDPILEMYVDDARSVEEIVASGYDEQTVRWVVRTVNRNEYKRWQAAPGLRVTSKAFGGGRRMPVAAKFDP